MANFPEDFKYTKDHTWVQPSGDGRVRMGITSYAVREILEGNIVSVELPKEQTTCDAHDPFTSIGSGTRVLGVRTPLAGTITAVNQNLDGSPEEIEADPYGVGWIIEMATTSADGMKDLLTATQYADYVTD